MDKCNSISVQNAIDKLKRGELVAIPTETVYGLAARFDDVQAVQNIFRRKGRPSKNPLIVHVYSIQQALDFVEAQEDELMLMHRFWPGPLTMVLRKKEKANIAQEVCACLPTVAVRCPSHPIALQILRDCGPLVAPSANPSGRPSPTLARHVLDDYHNDIPVVDGGACELGIESTIIGKKNGKWTILRPGALSIGEILTSFGFKAENFAMESGVSSEQPSCPGQMYRHYQPNAQVVLASEESCKAGDGVIGFEGREYKSNELLYLAKTNCPQDLQKVYYHCLRLADSKNLTRIWIDDRFPSPENLAWAGLKDRIKRSAAKE